MTYFPGHMGDEPSDKPSAAQSAADLAAKENPPAAPVPFIGPLFTGIADTLKSLVTGAGVEAGSAAANASVAARPTSNAKFLVLGGLAIVGAVLLFRKAAPAMNPRRRRRRR